MLRSIKNRLKGHTPAPAPAPAPASARPDASKTPRADPHMPRRQRPRRYVRASIRAVPRPEAGAASRLVVPAAAPLRAQRSV